HEDPLHHYPDAVRRARFSAAVCYPLANRGHSLGVLSFFYKTPREFEKREKDLGVILAHSMALAIENSLLMSEGKQNRLVTVQALIRSLEAKDSETSYHSLRVTQHATVLAEQMGLPPRQVEAVQYGATLHDLGKIGIIGTILNKKGKLSDDELVVVRRHPVVGARIVENVDYLSGAVPVIRHHHERFEGGGYPDGLAGEKIPLGARIVAIPDFYDALTTSRPYRPAYPHEKALAMIRERIGTAFDPEIARIFLQIQGGWKRPTH
ncbi:MAG: HD domain-containing protein, partial [Candidatus Latescibacterota bacterium]